MNLGVPRLSTGKQSMRTVHGEPTTMRTSLLRSWRSRCNYELGCRGPITHADCPLRLWNNKVSWCVGCGATCIGCTEPGFFDISPLYEKFSESALPEEV